MTTYRIERQQISATYPEGADAPTITPEGPWEDADPGHTWSVFQGAYADMLDLIATTTHYRQSTGYRVAQETEEGWEQTGAGINVTFGETEGSQTHPLLTTEEFERLVDTVEEPIALLAPMVEVPVQPAPEVG